MMLSDFDHQPSDKSKTIFSSYLSSRMEENINSKFKEPVNILG
jgi:hypothetical protein